MKLPPARPILLFHPAQLEWWSMNVASILGSPVLTLNSRWDPIQVTNVKEALCLVSKGSAMILDPETFATHDLKTWNDASRLKEKFGDSVIRSVRMRLVLPEVIVLTKYEGRGERAVVFSRRNIFKRDHYVCQYCGAQPGPKELTIDHVIPRTQGGIGSWENCVLSCLDCNSKKAGRTPQQAGMKLRKIPKKPSWRTLAQVSPRQRRLSWEHFLSDVYWKTELEP